MFLATTALSQFWDTGQETVFLSSGCLRYGTRSIWESLRYQVMPNPWDDRLRFYAAAHYLEGYYDQLLGQIAQYLDTVHQVSRGQRYWRIIVGPWLFHYLHAVYDRYTLLTDAFSKYPGLQTYTLDPQCFRSPRDMWEYNEWVCGDAYNLQLFSQLLQGMHCGFPTRALESSKVGRSVSPVPRNAKWRNGVKSVARSGLRLSEQGLSRCLGRVARAYLCDMYLPRAQTWSIAWRAGMRAIPMPIRSEWSFVTPGPAFNARRNNLAQLDAGDEFQAAFIQSLPHNFPSLYLEGFHLAQAETLKRWSRIPPVLVSVTGWYFNEPFKFLAAEASEKGSRLVAVQHGGLYGTGRFVPGERHELGLSDSYMVWGWADGKAESQGNLPSPKLSLLAPAGPKRPRPKREGPILMVTTAHPWYLLRFQSMPVGSQWTDYFEWERRFLEASPGRVRQAMLLRPSEKIQHVADIRIGLLNSYPEIRWDDGGPFHRRLKGARVVVDDYPGTTFLEAMTANIPTVLFWDRQRWEMRDEAEPYFESLREVGVLWDSPEAAAEHTAAIFDDPWEWWGDQGVQQTCQRFLHRYGLGRKDWAKCWADALREQAAMGR